VLLCTFVFFGVSLIYTCTHSYTLVRIQAYMLADIVVAIPAVDLR
jgi:hypothetical protein